jgi:hypothetical protein
MNRSRPRSNASGSVLAGVRYFLGVFAVGFGAGVVRNGYLVPRFGELVSVLLEAPVMLTAAWVHCGRVVSRGAVPPTLRARSIVGGVAFALLMAAEVLLSVVLFSRSPRKYVKSVLTPHGVVGLLAQIGFGLVPLLRRE